MVTEESFPLGYEVFAGNRHDSLTVKSVVESLERKHGALNRVWVMDRGMVSNDNLVFLRERGAKEIVGTPKAMLRLFERQLAERNWVVAQEGVAVKLVPSPDGQETFLLARSVARRSKELAMHETFIGHMDAGLKKLERAAESGRRKPRSGDIVLPAKSAGGIRTTVRLRHVTEPEAEQKTLLQRLGLQPPRRLKRLDSPAHME